MSKRRPVQWCLLAVTYAMLAVPVGWRPGVVTPAHLLADDGTHTATTPMPGSRAAVPRTTLMQVAAAPLHFERNDGQASPDVAFLARGAGYAVLISDTTSSILLSAPAGEHGDAVRSRAVQTRLVGAVAPRSITGEATLPGTVNYFRGNDPSRW